MRHNSPVDEAGAQPPRFTSAALNTFATQAAVAALSFVSVLVVSRVLGPAGRGDLALLTTIAVVSSTLAMFGLDEANVNFAGAEPRLRRSLATNSLVLSAIFGTACVGGLIGLLAAFPELGGEADQSLRWLAFAVIPVLILKVYLKFLIGADFAFGVVNLAWLFPPLAGVVVNVLLAAVGLLSVGTALGTWVAAHIVATGWLLWYVARRSVGFGRPDVALALRSLRFGVRSHVGRVTMVGNYRVDQWFVGAIAGSRELGLYSIAVAWSEMLFYLPTALVIAQRPYLVRASLPDAGRRAARVMRGSILVTAGFAVGIVALAPFLCVTVFGSAFRGSIDDLRLLALGAFGILALKLLGNALTAQGRPGTASLGATAAFVATIVLDVALIPPYGGLGAALASTLAYTVGGIVVLTLFVRVFRTRVADLIPRVRELPGFVREVLRPFSRLFASDGRPGSY